MTDAPATLAAPAPRQDGWVEIFTAHRAELVRIAQSRLHCAADAEDVVQEVLLRLLRGTRVTADVDSPIAYLRRAVANECASRWRRTNRQVLMSEVPDQPYEPGNEVALDRMVLRGALPGLTERQQRVILWTFLDDRADADIAATLGISEVTVRTTRLRALTRLRRLLDPATLGRPTPVATPVAVPPGRPVRVLTAA
jgi:RNA polymerase sigma factor (sigma-70 family)